MNTRVDQLLKQTRGRPGWISPSAGVAQALDRLTMERLDFIAVADASSIRGVVGRQHLDRCSACLSASCVGATRAPVEQVMSRSVTVVHPEVSVRASLRQLVADGSEYAAVVGARGFEGLLTLSEICASVAADLDEHVDELTHYICGTPSNPRPAKPAEDAVSPSEPKPDPANWRALPDTGASSSHARGRQRSS